MTNGSRRLAVRCIIAILMTAISVATMDSAMAQSRIGQIGRDGLTNRHESPSSETESLRLEMLSIPLFRPHPACLSIRFSTSQRRVSGIASPQ